jgi:hypothetical protein
MGSKIDKLIHKHEASSDVGNHATPYTPQSDSGEELKNDAEFLIQAFY